MSILSHILCPKPIDLSLLISNLHILYQGDYHPVLGLPSFGCGSEVLSCRKLGSLDSPHISLLSEITILHAFWPMSANSCFTYFVQFSSHLYYERKFSFSYSIIDEDGIFSLGDFLKAWQSFFYMLVVSLTVVYSTKQWVKQ